MEKEKSVEKKRLIIYVTLTMAITWIIFLMIPICGLTYGRGSSVFILAAAMFVPAFCSILTRLITKEGFKNMYLRPHFRGHMKQYLLLYFGPTALLFLSGAIYFLIFPGQLDTGLTVLKELTASSSMSGISASALLSIQVMQFIILGPVINIIPTLGEELGWRGYLLPKLRCFFSDRTALVVSGAIWGIWHLPVIVMGHNYGTGYAGYPWLGILAMVLFCIIFGTIEGYIAIKLESVIPAAMIHSALNAGAGLPLCLVKGEYNMLLGPAVTGLIGGLPFAVLAVVLFIKAGNTKASNRKIVQP